MTRFAANCTACGQCSQHGDCASAVIASLLDLPLSEVPFFVEANHGWWWWLEEWLDKRGLELEHVERENLPAGPVYCEGKSPRGFMHAVVWEGGPNGKVVHDPHPSRAGVAEPLRFKVIKPAAKLCGACGRGAP